MKLSGELKKAHFTELNGERILIIDEFKCESICISADEEKNIQGIENTDKPKIAKVLLRFYDEDVVMA